MGTRVWQHGRWELDTGKYTLKSIPRSLWGVDDTAVRAEEALNQQTGAKGSWTG
jgi:hypothetical protein